MSWENNRPDGWINPFLRQDSNGDFVDSKCFEAGADAMLKAIWKMAKESPTGTFTFDMNTISIFMEGEGGKTEITG